MPSAFSNTKLSCDLLQEYHELQTMILDAFILRVMFMCPPGNVGFDLLVPMLSKEALGKTAAELRTIIKDDQNVHHFIGILKVSVKTGKNVGRMIPDLVEERTKSPTAFTHINLGISFTENWSRDTIDISPREGDLKVGWVINVSQISPQLKNLFQSFGEKFELPPIDENLEELVCVDDLQDDEDSC
ncbi:hypothetical protein GEMRC1_010935 [Eukaryota sp. GEM-RC1]